MAAQGPHDIPDGALIERCLDALWIERGLSDNTLAAYRTDLIACARWLAAHASSLGGAPTSGRALAFS